jgi:hypothetical protein
MDHDGKKEKKAAKSARKENRKSSRRLREAEAPSVVEICYLVVGGGDIGQKLAHSLHGVHASWTEISLNAQPSDPLPEIRIRGQPLRSTRCFIIALDSPRVHLGEGGTGLANSIYGFIFAAMPGLNPPHVVFEFSEYVVTLAELNRLHREHGDAFPVQRISYYSHGIGT